MPYLRDVNLLLVSRPRVELPHLERPPSLGATPSRSRRSANEVIVVRKRTGA
jgi:hypothetical protein